MDEDTMDLYYQLRHPAGISPHGAMKKWQSSSVTNAEPPKTFAFSITVIEITNGSLKPLLHVSILSTCKA